ncbi:MAG: hypothetical protein JJV93_01305 [Alphaproteobacteria bacterium]|nr:hypothetical protein [Alphaproteobacteria bacterium]
MTTKKYEFIGEPKLIGGILLHRIRSLKNFGDVKKGDIGGWIGSEKDLSQEDNSWVPLLSVVSGYTKTKVKEQKQRRKTRLLGFGSGQER